MNHLLQTCVVMCLLACVGCTHIEPSADTTFLWFFCGMERDEVEGVFRTEHNESGVALNRRYYADEPGRSGKVLIALVTDRGVADLTLYLVFGKDQILTSIWTSKFIMKNPPVQIDLRCGDRSDFALLADEVYGE